MYYGLPETIFDQLTNEYEVRTVYCNRDYEPYALSRDKSILNLLDSKSIGFETFKDHVIFEKNEVVKDDGKPYTVFTPYSRKWKAYLANNPVKVFDTKKYSKNYFQYTAPALPTLASMGFTGSAATSFPAGILDVNIVKKYSDNRNFPAIENSTSKMGVHLRFGTVSVREILLQALPLNETYVNEIIWRDFYQAILFHFPKVGKGESFKKEYDFIKWRNNEKEFEHWCNGTTGYPIVDAGMRELNAGFMDSVRNRNLWSDVVSADGSKLPYKYDVLNGTKINDYDFMTRAFNAVSPFQINMGTTPTRDLLFRSLYDVKVSVNTGPMGEKLDASMKSKYQYLIGQQNVEAQLTDLFQNPAIAASIMEMEADRAAGRRYDAMTTLHNDQIKQVFDGAKQIAWAQLMADDDGVGQVARDLALTKQANTARKGGDTDRAKEILQMRNR